MSRAARIPTADVARPPLSPLYDAQRTPRPRASARRERARAAAAWCAALLLLLAAPAYAGDDAAPESVAESDDAAAPASRYGRDDRGDDFEGYPVDAGDPGDDYYDVSVEHRAFSPNWTGAFVGVGVLGGMHSFRAPYVSGTLRAPAYGAFINWASAQQALDLQLGYLGARASGEVLGGDATLVRHNIHAAVLAHPFFLGVLGGDRPSYTIAGWYLLIGAAVDITRVDAESAAEGAPDTTLVAPGWRFGTGIDTFLDSPEDGRAFWLGFQYQLGLVRGQRNNDEIGRQRALEHLLLLRLSYRWNGHILRGGFGPGTP